MLACACVDSYLKNAKCRRLWARDLTLVNDSQACHESAEIVLRRYQIASKTFWVRACACVASYLKFAKFGRLLARIIPDLLSNCTAWTSTWVNQDGKNHYHNFVTYYPTALRRVQITLMTSANITRYVYSRGPVRQVSCHWPISWLDFPHQFRSASHTFITHSLQINIQNISIWRVG